MNNRLIGNLALAAAMAVLLLLSLNQKDAWATSGSALDQIDLLVDLRHELATEYVDEPDQQAMIEGAIEGMIEALDDPYTQFFDIEEFQSFNESVRGEFFGIGAEVTIENNRLHIVTPLEDSPAWESGVMAGDTVLEIDGTDTLDLPIQEAIKLLKGPAGTDVTIKVRHANGEEAEITITRDKIEVQTVRGFNRDPEHRYNYFIDADRRIGYVRLTQFSERTADEVEQVLRELKDEGMTALILDLRFNPGGLLEAAVRISDLFLEADQTIVSVRGRVVPEKVFRSTGQTLLPEIPVVVLANPFSASASEIVAGALSDNDRALFVGERTFGKGSVQQFKMLEGGQGALKITNAYYYLPSGRNIHRRPSKETWGVDPSDNAYVRLSADQRRAMLDARRQRDVVDDQNGASAGTAVTPAWVRETLEDPQLAAALEAIGGRLESGDWPAVGESNAQALAKATERENLNRQRELLEETLAEVDQKLRDLDTDGPSAGITEPEADAQTEAAAAPEAGPDPTPAFTPGDIEEELTETPAEEAAESEPESEPAAVPQ
jgi:carboxyl-terminal processing protease